MEIHKRVFNLALSSFKRGSLRSCRRTEEKNLSAKLLIESCSFSEQKSKYSTFVFEAKGRLYKDELGTVHFKPFSSCLLSYVDFWAIVTKLLNFRRR